MLKLDYKYPECGHLTELSCIEDISNSQEPYPISCQRCGMKFRKNELLNFTRHKAELMVKSALASIK